MSIWQNIEITDVITRFILGFTMGIPDTVMGLTLVAVGVSVPDALSSLCVVKQGLFKLQ